MVKSKIKISSQTKQGVGRQRQIMSMVKGLGRFTVECGFIYQKSIIGGSILYATETVITIKEENFRHIEQIEEDQMQKLF